MINNNQPIDTTPKTINDISVSSIDTQSVMVTRNVLIDDIGRIIGRSENRIKRGTAHEYGQRDDHGNMHIYGIVYAAPRRMSLYDYDDLPVVTIVR